MATVDNIPSSVSAKAAQRNDDVAHARPYQDANEHLIEAIGLHDLLLRREFARKITNKSTDYLSFAAITDDEIVRLLETDLTSRGQDKNHQQVLELTRRVLKTRQHIGDRVAQTIASERRLPLVELAQRFRLSPTEIDILIACAAAEIDRRYERIYGHLQNDMTRKQPSPGLVLSLCGDELSQQLSARALLTPHAPLRHYRIIELVDDGTNSPWLSKPLQVDERMVSFLLGDNALDSRVERYATWLDPALKLDCLTRHQRTELSNLIEQIALWFGNEPARNKPAIYLHGPADAGIENFVWEATHHFGLPVLVADLESLCTPGLDFGDILFLLFREGLLNQASLLLKKVDRALDPDPGGKRYRELIACLADMGGLVFFSGESPWHWPIPTEPIVFRSFESRPAGFLEQFEVWHQLVGTHVSDAELHRLISRYPMAPGTIAASWRNARTLANADTTAKQVAIEHLEQACNAHAKVPASGLARRIRPTREWDDIVLPPLQSEQLHALCGQAKQLSKVYGAWGFERRLSLGKGINALFSGPPGTGKTMAAEVIAADLGLDILKIDLSQIVSKYIGETEKNLRHLFDQADKAHAILFFDEADALLGKRSEVKDAHDRYANTEVAYLLQKMEEYEGIAILATNLRQNMDEAFTRRMRFIVEFPFPEEDDRLRIWERIWPDEVPLAPDVELVRLARQFRLSGGNIRNIALGAAFVAADQSQSVSMQHLLSETKREMQKIGRLVNEDEYSKHG